MHPNGDSASPLATAELDPLVRGQNGGLGSDIDGKVLRAHPDVDAGMMAGDRYIHVLWWSGKGKDLLGHVMTHPTSGGRDAAVSFRDAISHGRKIAVSRLLLPAE